MTYQISGEVLWKIVDNEAVMLRLEKEDFYCLNPIGTEILTMISKKYSEDKIISSIADKYDCNKLIIKKDVRNFLVSMEKAGLLVKKGSFKKSAAPKKDSEKGV